LNTISPQQRAAVEKADNPFTILRHDWRAVLKATWAESSRDNVSLVAAGTAFWGFTALAPMLAATVLTYGLFANPQTVASNISSLFRMLPRDAAALIAHQLSAVVQTSADKKGLGLALALLIALYGGLQGSFGVISALNIAYEEEDRRGWIRLYGVALAITVASVLLAIAAAILMALIGYLDSLIPGAPPLVSTLMRVAGYVVLTLLAMTAAALLYRFAPHRTPAKWIWITPGSVSATLLWVAATSGFALYVARFGTYGATYGSLSAVVVLLFWLWISAYAFILGGELNSQLERRTAADTTTGPPAPVGQRGAAVADHVGPDVPSPEKRAALRELKSAAAPRGAMPSGK